MVTRPVLAAILVGLWCLAIDRLFRSPLPGLLAAEPLGARILVFSAKAVLEEVLYRGILGTGLVLVLQRPALAFLLAQILNVSLGHPAGGLLYVALRFVAPGMVWAWLYWRAGLGASIAGHIGAHLVYQPLIRWAC